VIIKLNRKEWDDKRSNTTIANKVKEKLNGKTPSKIICETISLGDEVEIKIKL